MTQPKRPLKVFLCHAHADRDPVCALYSRLTQDGVDAWLDKAKLLPGQDWELEIRKAVREADVVVVCLSKQFNQAGFRQKEVRLALDTAMEKPEGEIFIIPARLEDCDTLESLRKWHWVDLFEDDGYEMLIRALQTRANKIDVTLHTRRTFLPKVATAQVKKEKVVPENKSSVQKQERKLVKSSLSKILNSSNTKVNLPSWLRRVSALFLILIIAWLAFTNLEKWMLPIFNALNSWRPFPNIESSTMEPNITSSLEAESTDDKSALMILVPAGEFTMGSNEGNSNERPVHSVILDAFWINKTEVTNAMYTKCVQTGKCNLPYSTKSSTRSNYYGNPEFDDYPVIFVSWNDAKAYCEWADRRLPTEAEWEKAARGTDERIYPWGGNTPTADLLNFNGSIGDTAMIGNYLDGASPYSVLDMAGNVWEWVNDLYSATYYSISPEYNPIGPDTGQYRVLRGGAWSRDKDVIRTSYRQGQEPSLSVSSLGFRCAKDVSP